MYERVCHSGSTSLLNTQFVVSWKLKQNLWLKYEVVCAAIPVKPINTSLSALSLQGGSTFWLTKHSLHRNLNQCSQHIACSRLSYTITSRKMTARNSVREPPSINPADERCSSYFWRGYSLLASTCSKSRFQIKSMTKNAMIIDLNKSALQPWQIKERTHIFSISVCNCILVFFPIY